MDFKSPSGSVSGQPSKEQVMAQVKQQIAVAQAQELLTEMSDKCFKKCVYSPSSALSSSEQKCLDNCSGRFMEVFNLINTTYMKRLGQEMSGAGGIGGGAGGGSFL